MEARGPATKLAFIRLTICARSASAKPKETGRGRNEAKLHGGVVGVCAGRRINLRPLRDGHNVRCRTCSGEFRFHSVSWYSATDEITRLWSDPRGSHGAERTDRLPCSDLRNRRSRRSELRQG